MTNSDKPSTSPATPKATVGVGKSASQKPEKDTPSNADGLIHARWRTHRAAAVLRYPV